MSTAAARPNRLALAGAASLAMVTSSLALAAPATSAEGCAWQRHSKAVLKKVKRHGHTRRVKHLKHWWTCEALPASVTPAATLPSPSLPETPAAEEPQPQIPHLGVKAVEYSYTLSRPEVDAGETIVELNNQGEDPHDLRLQREGSEEPALEIPKTAALEQKSAHFDLAAGTYHLYCSLFKHDGKGMNATLVVAPRLTGRDAPP